MPPDPCTAIRRISNYVARWIQLQQNVGEESITDWLLYESARRIPQIAYRKFTRSEEAKESGADFDWCLLTSRRCLTFRVQSKRAPGNTDLYPSIAYSNRHGLQIERLIEASRSDNVRPTYAFYTDPIPGTPFGCQFASKAGPRTGAFLAPAGWVYHTFVVPARSQVMRENLLGKSIPLECLACCHLAQKSLDQFLQAYFAQVDANAGADISSNLGVSDAPPGWASALLQESLQRGASNTSVPDWWDREYAHLAARTGAVLVWDLRR